MGPSSEAAGMNWEALSAVSTAFTALVILATAIYAARQVGALNEQSKVLAAQIEHLRRATQLDGTLAVFDEISLPEFQAAYRFVMTEFEDRMQDERFHADSMLVAPDPDVHPEVIIMRHMERIGTLVKSDLLEEEVLLDFAGLVVRATWSKLKPLALEQRLDSGENELWENFEFLAMRAARFNAANAAKDAS